MFARRERLQAQLDQIDDTGTVVVVPTLESFEAADFAQAAGEGDIAAVREMVRAEQLTLFHSQNFRAGHGATDLEEWLRHTVGERAHSFAASRGQHHHLHEATPIASSVCWCKALMSSRSSSE